MIEQLDMFAAEHIASITEFKIPPHLQDRDHGTNSVYCAGCRCEPCRTAHRSYQRDYQAGIRTCQQCRVRYQRGHGGTKFCETCINDGVYARGFGGYRPRRTCARCLAEYKPKSNPNRWGLCVRCTSDPVFTKLHGSLGNHNAPLSVVLAVMDWPYCANEHCGQWLLQPAHYKRANHPGKTRWGLNFAIDHDHACCPGNRSCGRCIRGILCRACNGAIPDSMDSYKAEGIANYLTRYAQSQT